MKKCDYPQVRSPPQTSADFSCGLVGWRGAFVAAASQRRLPDQLAGHAPGMAMEVFNSGTTDLTALIMFVVDATRPFSEPAKLP
jgi:hypothetical protein